MLPVKQYTMNCEEENQDTNVDEIRGYLKQFGRGSAVGRALHMLHGKDLSATRLGNSFSDRNKQTWLLQAAKRPLQQRSGASLPLLVYKIFRTVLNLDDGRWLRNNCAHGCV